MRNRVLDPYAVLGVRRDATPLQVARAHRRLAKRYHPDLHPDSEAVERMQRINEAWRILSSAIQRADYDLANPTEVRSYGHWAASRREVRPAPPNSTRTWATWRASAAETMAAPRTMRQPEETPIPRTRRPRRPEPEERVFLDTGWAALLVAGALVFLVVLAAYMGSVSRPLPPF